jgi:hypothetical protein
VIGKLQVALATMRESMADQVRRTQAVAAPVDDTDGEAA